MSRRDLLAQDPSRSGGAGEPGVSSLVSHEYRDRVSQLVERVETVERMIRLLADHLGVDLDRLLLLADCDCDAPLTWEQWETCGRDPETGEWKGER